MLPSRVAPLRVAVLLMETSIRSALVYCFSWYIQKLAVAPDLPLSENDGEASSELEPELA